MIDRGLVEVSFQEWFESLWKRRSVVDLLGTRPDVLLYEAYKASAQRFYAEGVQEGMRRAEEEAEKRLARARRAEADPLVQQHRQGMERREPPGSVVTSRNAEGTASATHIPIVIEGEIHLDRQRSIGEYLREDSSG
jgi:hypothetical protein